MNVIKVGKIHINVLKVDTEHSRTNKSEKFNECIDPNFHVEQQIHTSWAGTVGLPSICNCSMLK